MGFFDSLGGMSSASAGLDARDRERLGAQGLLQLGIGLLSSKGGFGNALANGLNQGLLSINQGAND